MNIAYYTTRLTANAYAIESFVKHTDITQALWKPKPGKWSILEVICHLYDVERLDFRPRLEYLLANPGEAWPVIDPESWVQERRYAEQDIVEMLTLFRREREHSVAWLANLEAPDWGTTYAHPDIGDITAGSLLASWVAHDYLHMRQMARLKYQHLATTASPHSLDYAGGW